MIKKFRSIDGYFNDNLNYDTLNEIKKIKKKKYSLLGLGNPISNLPFNKNSVLIKNNLKDKISLNKKNLELTANGNIEVYKLHNFLIKNSLYNHCFPSYPSVTLGACVANNVHGINPKNGCINKWVKKLKIYNPNIGYKTLTKSQNTDLFNLTIGGLGLTGIIIEVTIKVLRLKSTFVKKKTQKFNSILDGYKFLKKSKNLYNQNNFFISNSKKNFCNGIISSGTFYGKKKIYKKLKKKTINPIRLGILDYNLFRYLLNTIFTFFKIYLDKNIIHINEALFPSNQKLFYFNLLNSKFIEHQIIIPHKKVKSYLKDFKKIVIKHQPSITLCHLKIFSGKSNYLRFDENGLGMSIHILKNKKFNTFFKKLQSLDLIHGCKINLYKNSILDLNVIKKNYGKTFINFKNKIRRLNRNIYFTNNIFNEKFYNG